MHGRRDIIKLRLTEVGLEGVEWIDLAQDRDEWRAVINVWV